MRFSAIQAARLIAVLLVMLVLVVGCDSSKGPSPEDSAAIEKMLLEYLPLLGQAYATGDLGILRPYAVEKEVARLYKAIGDLMSQENRVVEPTLQSLTVEQITVWNYANAFVTTIEVWDLKVLASGTDRITSEVAGQRNRVRYQLKRRDDGWKVLYREIETTFD